jgi:hypothetical protein
MSLIGTILANVASKGGLSAVDVFTVVSAVVIIGGGALGVYHAVGRLWRQTIGSRRDLARRVNQLAAGTTIRYVEARFGTPVFEAKSQLTAQLLDGSKSCPPLRELVYRERHAWIQVLADDHNAVARFSITVTDPRFRFSTRLLTRNFLNVKLGRSRFSDTFTTSFIPGRPRPVGRVWIGAHNYGYSECYGFGNPGAYQAYILSHNQIGAGKWNSRGARLTPGTREFDAGAPWAQSFWAGTTINTLTVVGPAWGPGLGAEPLGPHDEQVRVLVPGGIEGWRWRRRVRRWEREAHKAMRNQPESAGPLAQ